MMQLDSDTVIKVAFKRSEYGCVGVVLLFLAIPTCIIFCRTALFAYIVFSMRSSMAIGVSVILIVWALLLWFFVYAMGKVCADTATAIHIDKHGIWIERFYKRNSHLFKWEDIVAIQHTSSSVEIRYCKGYRYWYQTQTYDYEYWQRQNYYQPNRNDVFQHKLPKKMVGYNEYEWLNLLQYHFNLYAPDKAI
ncbi:hypothetical protein [Vitreoscilla stercoraria]|uniref:Uncharacterized protein n=1 Tax=Vitreoscilla stercoraria TaxID=61 RepID=A0ABY4EC02_VITST|nr:hypothetical protein [Vitreoscilla stercoraria]UOO93277.1 hypothetical protein LVJ81_04390 [Vitreoscilla stercoraria]